MLAWASLVELALWSKELTLPNPSSEIVERPLMSYLTPFSAQ
jgi:hypothetical protein